VKAQTKSIKRGKASKLKHPVELYRGTRIRHVVERGCYQVDYTALGHRERKRFADLSKAKLWVDQKNVETENQGRGAFNILDRDRLDIAEARKWLPCDVRLSDVCEFWKVHHPQGEQKTIAEIVDAFLDSDKGRRGKRSVTRRKRTSGDHIQRLSRMAAKHPLDCHCFRCTFGHCMAHEVTQADVEHWLDANDWRGLNRDHYLSSVKAMFNAAIRNGQLVISPAEKIETVAHASEEAVIMTVKDIEKYLIAMETACTMKLHRGNEYRTDCLELLPREAIGFFCGLRPEELSRLDWRNVSLDNKLITVTKDVAKIQGHRRNVTMPDCLVAWLAPYAKDSGPVWPYASNTTLNKKRRMAREAAGVDVPQNAARHAFASYHLAAHSNAPETAEQMGHSDIKLLRDTYRNIVASDGRPITKSVGEKYFNTVPKRKVSRLQFRKAS
jgi:integrase